MSLSPLAAPGHLLIYPDPTQVVTSLELPGLLGRPWPLPVFLYLYLGKQQQAEGLMEGARGSHTMDLNFSSSACR